MSMDIPKMASFQYLEYTVRNDGDIFGASINAIKNGVSFNEIQSIKNFKWVTIRGKHVNIGKGGGGGARPVPAYSGADSKTKGKLDAIQNLMKATREGGNVDAASVKAVQSGAKIGEILSVEKSGGKDAIIESKGGKHSIWSKPSTATKAGPKVTPGKKPVAKKPPIKKKPEPKKKPPTKEKPVAKKKPITKKPPEQPTQKIPNVGGKETPELAALGEQAANKKINGVVKMRDDYCKSHGISKEDIASYDKRITMWGMSSNGDGARELGVISNIARGKPRHDGLLDVTAGTKAFKPTDGDVKTFKAITAFNQSVLRRKVGDPVETHRGVSGKFASSIKKSAKGPPKTNRVKVPTRALQSDSTSRDMANGFAYHKDYGHGIVMSRKAKVSGIMDSHLTNKQLSLLGESEMVYMGGSKTSVTATITAGPFSEGIQPAKFIISPEERVPKFKVINGVIQIPESFLHDTENNDWIAQIRRDKKKGKKKE